MSDTKPCPKCDGTGKDRTARTVSVIIRQPALRLLDCARCKGSGKVEA